MSCLCDSQFIGRIMQKAQSFEWDYFIYWEPWYPSQSSGLLNRKNANSFAFLNPVPFAELRAFNRQKANSLAFWNPDFTVLLSKQSLARIMINKKAPVFRLGLFHLLGAWRCTTLAWHLPHYHRRSCVSLLSSEWVQVVPQRYCHQAKTVMSL